MRILAIETSCDDTCAAVIRVSGKTNPRFKILSNIVSSQVEVHRKWGGVYPTLAKREHQRNLIPVLKKVLMKSNLLKIFNFPGSSEARDSSKSCFSIFNEFSISKFQTLKKILKRENCLYRKSEKFLKKYQKPKVDLIAVTVGPGLEPCLWLGVNFAKALSYYWDLPIIPVNHLEAHIFANFVGKTQNSKFKTQNFPAVCLVVSGGHTQLILMENFGKYKILGETRDDAAGECFDKVAKILGLGYPGGPIIAANAAKFSIFLDRAKRETPRRVAFQFSLQLPRPMIYQKNYDFSFSGLKTAVLYNFKKQSPKIRKNKKYIQEMCYEVQQAIIDVLIKKTIGAAKGYRAKTIILGGGVSANKELRKQFKEKINKELPDTKYLIPDTKYSTDNAAMAGVTGYYHWLKGKTKNWQSIKADANLKIC